MQWPPGKTAKRSQTGLRRLEPLPQAHAQNVTGDDVALHLARALANAAECAIRRYQRSSGRSLATRRGRRESASQRSTTRPHGLRLQSAILASGGFHAERLRPSGPPCWRHPEREPGGRSADVDFVVHQHPLDTPAGTPAAAPKVSRILAYSTANSCALTATPMQAAAYGMRWRARRSLAMEKPPPSARPG